MPPSPQWSDDQIDEMLNRMREGETLTSIAADARMPSIQTMANWEAETSDLGLGITRARELGYTIRAEKALAKAQAAEDPAKGRLAFDAERWFLGKMHPKKFGERKLIGSDPENPLPAGGLDASKLSTEALKEILAARDATDAD